MPALKEQNPQLKGSSKLSSRPVAGAVLVAFQDENRTVNRNRETQVSAEYQTGSSRRDTRRGEIPGFPRGLSVARQRRRTAVQHRPAAMATRPPQSWLCASTAQGALLGPRDPSIPLRVESGREGHGEADGKRVRAAPVPCALLLCCARAGPPSLWVRDCCESVSGSRPSRAQTRSGELSGCRVSLEISSSASPSAASSASRAGVVLLFAALERRWGGWGRPRLSPGRQTWGGFFCRAFPPASPSPLCCIFIRRRGHFPSPLNLPSLRISGKELRLTYSVVRSGMEQGYLWKRLATFGTRLKCRDGIIAHCSRQLLGSRDHLASAS
uniref:uncharacterized protein LOC128931992 n=1 Tax=Callithrix jacchus TaxID=9483 RepID=UPI0023DD3283|nr:uncharacterized protein LOC128931992 [Callithrix jacchus]